MGAARSGRIPNAYLFVGANAQTLLDEALFFAGVLNCSTGQEEGCRECISCTKIARRIHPDLLIISSSGKSQPAGRPAEAGRHGIKIDEIRQLSGFVKYGPALGKWKIIIVESADLMTEEASNSFLKMLEEPLDHILFILTTTRQSHILKTVASRCQKIMFSNEIIMKDETVDMLTERFMSMDKMDMLQMLSFSEELSGLEGLEEKLNQVLYNYREKVDYRSEKGLLAVKPVFNAIRALEKRGNRRLAIDNMIFMLREGVKN